jgi:hypothetical protein
MACKCGFAVPLPSQEVSARVGAWRRNPGSDVSYGSSSERLAVTGPNRRKVAAVEGDDRHGPESLGERDNRRVGPAQWEVSVLVDELGDTCEVLTARPLDVELAYTLYELALCAGTQSLSDEVGCLGDDQRGHNQAQVRRASPRDRVSPILDS